MSSLSPKLYCMLFMILFIFFIIIVLDNIPMARFPSSQLHFDKDDNIIKSITDWPIIINDSLSYNFDTSKDLENFIRKWMFLFVIGKTK